MSQSAILEVSVLVRAAPDLAGEWIAHCLNLDLLSQGCSPGHAIQRISEAIVLSVEDDLVHGLDPQGQDGPGATRH